MTEPKITRRKITEYAPDAQNANRGTERGHRMLDDSVTEVGLGRSVVADKNGKLIGGNKTQQAAVDNGFEDAIEIETDGKTLVVVKRTDLDLNDPEPNNPARRMAYYDNRVSAVNLDFDPAVLLHDMQTGVDLSKLWTPDELAELLAGMQQDEPAADPGAQVDRADELQKIWQVSRGDVWQISNHRLMCGDSTSAEDVARLMDGAKASICFTSPPYNAGVSAQLRGNTHLDDSLYISSDDNLSNDDYRLLLNNFTCHALDFCEYVFVNIQPLAGNKTALIDYWFNHKDVFCDVAIWDKQHAAPAMAQRVMNSQFEFVFVFSRQNQSRAIGTRDFRGTVANVYSAPPQRNNENADLHGATMPLHFPVWICENFTNRGELVYEPFAGTGTTLVACEQTGRRGYGMELSEAYTSVCLQRLKDMGLSPERVS